MITALKKKFSYPIEVRILVDLQNGIDIEYDKAKHTVMQFDSGDGIMRRAALFLKKRKIRIPSPDLKFIQKFGKRQVLWLLHLNRNLYLPLIMGKGEMTAYLQMEKKDKDGKLILDREGLVQYDYVKRKIFDATIAFDNGTAIQMPTLYAAKSYDLDQWQSNELIFLNQHYKKNNKWKDIAPYIFFFLLIAGGIIALYIVNGHITEMGIQAVNALSDIAPKIGEQVAIQVKNALGGNMTATTAPAF